MDFGKRPSHESASATKRTDSRESENTEEGAVHSEKSFAKSKSLSSAKQRDDDDATSAAAVAQFLPSVLSLPLLLRRVRGDAVLIGRDDGRALSLSHTHVRPFLPSFFLQLRGSKERPKEHARVRTHATTRGPSSRAPARHRVCLPASRAYSLPFRTKMPEEEFSLNLK